MGLLDAVFGNASKIDAAGALDMDAELKIWLSGSSTVIQKTFSKRLNILDVQSVLASYVLR